MLAERSTVYLQQHMAQMVAHADRQSHMTFKTENQSLKLPSSISQLSYSQSLNKSICFSAYVAGCRGPGQTRAAQCSPQQLQPEWAAWHARAAHHWPAAIWWQPAGDWEALDGRRGRHWCESMSGRGKKREKHSSVWVGAVPAMIFGSVPESTFEFFQDILLVGCMWTLSYAGWCRAFVCVCV